MNFVVRSGFYLLVAVCILQVGNGYEIRIQREPDTIDVQDLNITLSCSVIGEIENVSRIEWLLHKNKITKCNTSVSEKVCNVTIRGTEQTDVYTCIAYVNSGDKETKETTINGCGDKYAAILGILDGSTREMVDVDAESICIPPGATRSFECSVQDEHISACPSCVNHASWNISWIFENATHPTNVSATSYSCNEDNVTASSWLNVSNSGNKNHLANFTCRATSHSDRMLNATVKLQFCYGPSYHQTLLSTVIGICVTTTIAFVIAIILIFKFNVDL